MGIGSMKIKDMTREEWLEAALDELIPIVEAAHGTPFKRPRVSVGFGDKGSHSVLGWCFPSTVSEDGRAQIFISPTLKPKAAADAENGVLATLLHEVCHAALPPGTGHGKPFAKLAEAVGLEGPWTATSASPALVPALDGIMQKLGPYPHATLRLNAKNKQTTRMIKCQCGSCGYICRTTHEWLDKAGAPLCPCNTKEMDYE